MPLDPELTTRLIEFPLYPEELAFRDDEALRDHLHALEGVDVVRIGFSRDANEMFGVECGDGPRRVSIIAGCHADEPIGPMTAQILPRVLRRSFPELLQRFRFNIVAQMNPDGADRNRDWFSDPLDLSRYLAHVLRELPGDDIEFGFGSGPRVRPECSAAQGYLKRKGPFAAHFSLHGMAFAEGAWCLICREWEQRSVRYMNAFAELCHRIGFPLHDVDRNGEKGFYRIREGFCTTPTATAMREHFRARNDHATANRFLSSSMEWVQSLGGDPLCVVSELPLFRIGRRSEDRASPVSKSLKADLMSVGEDFEEVSEIVARYVLTATPIELQVRLQIWMIVLALTSSSA